MIAKHVPMKSARKSAFAGLVKYLVDVQDKSERLGTLRVTNCQSDSAEVATLEVLGVQAQNTRAKADKTYHLLLSFRDGEAPDDVALAAIEERVCAGIGFAGHQRISVTHRDTDNLHIHIAINKIHPSRHTIHEPFNAYHTLAKLCEKMEREYGLEKDNHKARRLGGENQAADMERHADVESLLGWIKRECGDRVRAARSWSELHLRLREHGLAIGLRANGLVFTSENGLSVKASSVDRKFSKSSLEARLGGFEPSGPMPETEPARRYARKPMPSRVDTTELFARYEAAQKGGTSSRATEWSRAVARKKRLIEDAKRGARLKRAAIKFMRAPRLAKRLMYLAVSNSLRDEIESIGKLYLEGRQRIYEKHHRRTWADWLRSEAMAGDEEALAALRARAISTGLKGNTVTGASGTRSGMADVGRDGITKKGTIIYKAGAGAVRDDGSRLSVSRGADQACIEAALELAIRRYGGRIAVNGTAAFKQQIVLAAVAANLPVSFADAALEGRRRQLAQPTPSKENNHGNDKRNRSAARPADRRRDGGGRQAAASRAGHATRERSAAPGEREHARGHQPDTQGIGPAPPPEARHRLRELSEFGVVHVAEGGEVLLPGHVSRHLEHQGSKPDHRLRRDLRRPGRPLAAPATPALRLGVKPDKPNVARAGTAPPPAGKDRLRSLAQLGAIVIEERPSPQPEQANDSDAEAKARALEAARKYVFEREQKRRNGFDIPKHSPYTFNHAGYAEYAGLRRIDGHTLALLKFGAEVMVLAVDEATARRLKRLSIGQQVVVSATGVVKTKGMRL